MNAMETHRTGKNHISQERKGFEEMAVQQLGLPAGQRDATFQMALLDINPRYARVLEMRYGEAGKPVSYAAIAAKEGVNGTRISAIRRKAMDYLRWRYFARSQRSGFDISVLDLELPFRILSSLVGAGIYTLEQLGSRTFSCLLHVEGIGEHYARAVERELNRRGYQLKEESVRIS